MIRLTATSVKWRAPIMRARPGNLAKLSSAVVLLRRCFTAAMHVVCLPVALVLALALSALPVMAEDGFGKLREAARIAEEYALSPPDHKEAVANAVRGYLGTMDVYSSYLTEEQYAAFFDAPQSYAGIGMDLLQGPGNTLYCLPYPGGPAHASGIMAGDMLYSVNKTPVASVPLLFVEGLIRGESGSKVLLGIASAEGAREVMVERRTISRKSVELYADQGYPRLRLWRFDEHTLPQLQECLNSLEPASPLIIDIRGNVGGDLHSAIDCAELFLKKDSLITVLEERGKARKEFRAQHDRLFLTAFTLVWQDTFTASAAEVFCAALKDNGLVKTTGQNSFGKGIAQSLIPAGDKDFFILTTGKLLRPSGESFHGKGIEADLYIAPGRDNTDQQYMRRSREFFALEE